eukprot:TRINITY_DN14933_c0_g1_i1.p1 TRINITY_DN14933_c0_g1~~TRINITY_DN14933_c0_g1_i1.p1  ORF type:complete len:291 (+),score=20.99 TRINITY_DN14933_c0_g1_i1:39-875(+)
MSSEPSFSFSLIAGGIGQAAELLTLGHILTRIATEQQAHPSTSLLNSTRSIYNKGFTEFYRGLRWNLVLSALKGGTRWGLNNSLFAFYTKLFPGSNKLVPAIVGVTGAAIETTFVLCPFESLRTREMTTNWQNGQLEMYKVVKAVGPKIFVVGWPRIFIRQTVNWVSYLMIYDTLRNTAKKASGKENLTLPYKIFVASGTGIFAAIFATPFDMLRTQIQKDKPLGINLWNSTKIVYTRYGLYGLYSSLLCRIMRSCWYSVITLLTMDYLQALPQRMKL